MAILVLYATKSGATEQCAKLLSEELPACTVCNIGLEKPDIEKFDRIILGAGVKDGKIYKPIRDFIKKNQPELLKKGWDTIFVTKSQRKRRKSWMKIFLTILKKQLFVWNRLAAIRLTLHQRKAPTN
ncbi:flavodoxin domain-containing protein [Paenibacillus sp. MBLB4367]|uniref:flavodoxin domain-containing protein n=1 Tax=Paenibacillus sp. MBLB4367 TaxID=3384767 RepID=UPI003908316D